MKPSWRAPSLRKSSVIALPLSQSMEIYLCPPAWRRCPESELLKNSDQRRQLLSALYDNFEQAYSDNHLVHLIRRHRPEVIVDCVNTATGISYQDVFDGAAKVRDWINQDGFSAAGIGDLEALLLSQTGPQLILSRALCASSHH